MQHETSRSAGRGSVVVMVMGALALGLGCSGGADEPPPPPSMPDGGAPGACDADSTALQQQVGDFLQPRCTNPACHLPVGPRWPSFAADDLGSLVASGLVVPGDPDGSRLMHRLDPADPRMIMPPTVASHDAHDIALVRDWISAGAPTDCDTETTPAAPHPNSLPQGSLFTCEDPSAPRSSPARLRRLEQSEWVHSLGGVLSRQVFLGNPFTAPEGAFSTYAGDGSVSPNTLALYVDVLERSLAFSGAWYRRPGATEPRCITRDLDVVPDDACRDGFVHDLLEHAVLFRAPEPEEHAAIRAYLDDELALEAASDAVDRAASLERVAAAAWMLPGALFRSELGEGAPRGRLSGDETALALAAVLTTYAPTDLRSLSYAPRPELGWLAEYRTAQSEGALDDVEALRTFVGSVLDPAAGYVGGEDASPHAAGRVDLQRDYGYDGDDALRRRRRRGEHWLAPRIATFFREYFGYGDVWNRFKDTPIATTRWESAPGPVQNAVSGGYYSIQRRVANEPMLADQLDDTIARAIVESEQGGGDAFRALLTGRTWRVPAVPVRSVSIGESCDIVACSVSGSACCPTYGCLAYDVRSDGSIGGRCSQGIYDRDGDAADHGTLQMSRVYGLDEPRMESEDPRVAVDQALRWATMPEDERAGVLTHPAWLSAHGGGFENDANAVLRGRWIREHLFCESVGGLDLVQLQAQLRDGTGDMRARDRLHATFDAPDADPRCSNAACHGAMNSLGMPFEIFNHAGFLRSSDHGMAPDGSSVISNWPGRGRVEVADALELAELLGGDPHVRRCFIRHVFRFFMGRDEAPADACTLAEMETAFAGGSFFAMLRALVTSETFLFRHAEGGAP